MAREPKIQPSTEVAAVAPVPEPATAPPHRGRRPKTAAAPPAPLAAASVDDPATHGVGADAAKAGPTKTPGRRSPGRKPEQQAGAEAAALPLNTAMETDATLSPEQERFAAEAVASGRCRDGSEVAGAALDGIKQLERRRAALLASVIAAEQEGERDGFLTGDEVAARVRATIARRSAAPA